MEVEIRKRVDTNKIVGDLNMVNVNMIDEALESGDKELIINTCEEAALIITELCYQLRNTKEALNKYMNGEEIKDPKEIEMEAGHYQAPKCFGEYLDENCMQCNYIRCKFRKLCMIRQEKNE